MTTTYVNIQSIQEFQDRMDLLGKEAEKMIQESMYMSLNDSNVRSRIIRLTPMSTPRRYAYNYKLGQDYHKDDGKWAKGTRSKSERAEKAGGQSGTLRKSFRLEIKGTDEVTIGHTAPYAGYVHEMSWLHGKYWVPGKKGGFTTPGTDAKFVSQVLIDQADVIPEKAAKALDGKMREKGIF